VDRARSAGRLLDGRVAVGKTASRTFTLANTGGKLRVRLAGPAAFAITGGTCRGASLKPGKKCTVAVRFAPASAAGFTATLTAAGKKHGATATDVLTGTGGELGQAPGGHIYWAAGSTIKQASLDGSSPQTIVTDPGTPVGVAADPSHVYWGSTGGGDGIIWKANPDGSSAQVIAAGQFNPGGVAVNASHIYWAASTSLLDGSGAIWEANLDGTSPHAVVTGQNHPFGVAVDGSHIYWAAPEDRNGNPGAIWEANLDGTSPHAFIGGSDNPLGVAVDGSRIYWTDSGNGTINEANLDGSQPHILFGGQDGPASITVGS